MTDANQWLQEENPTQTCLDSLQHGLLLEDRPLLIPWKAKIAQIRERFSPDEIITNHSWEELYWRKTRLLAGLPAPLVQVILYPHGWFDSACVVLERSSDEFRIQHSYQQALAHLSLLLGSPGRTCATNDCENVHTLATWASADLHLSLVWRLADPLYGFANQVCVHIAHR